MPTYDYMCDFCETAFEVQHKMTDTPVIVCPECGQTAHQVFSAGFGLNFTGKGFYQTDIQKTQGAVSSSPAQTELQSADHADKPAHTCNCSNGCCCSS